MGHCADVLLPFENNHFLKIAKSLTFKNLDNQKKKGLV